MKKPQVRMVVDELFRCWPRTFTPPGGGLGQGPGSRSACRSTPTDTYECFRVTRTACGPGADYLRTVIADRVNVAGAGVIDDLFGEGQA